MNGFYVILMMQWEREWRHRDSYWFAACLPPFRVATRITMHHLKVLSNHNHDHNSHHKITFPSLYTLRFKARYFFSISNLSWRHLWFYVSCHDIQFFNSHGICDNEIVKDGLKKSGIFPDLVKPTNSLKWEY